MMPVQVQSDKVIGERGINIAILMGVRLRKPGRLYFTVISIQTHIVHWAVQSTSGWKWYVTGERIEIFLRGAMLGC